MKYIKILIVMFITMICTSCLESNLEGLDTYTGNEITSVQGVYYRYYSSDKINASGQVAVKQVSLNVSNTDKDANTGRLNFTVTIPTNFPEAEKEKIKSSELVVVFNISTAAIIEPVDGAPKLGTPGDWNKPNRYKVTAADGSQIIWTVTLDLK